MYRPFLSLFLLSLLFTGYASAQENYSNSIEFSPQVSVGVFMANHKLSGTTFGGEVLYYWKSHKVDAKHASEKH